VLGLTSYLPPFRSESPFSSLTVLPFEGIGVFRRLVRFAAFGCCLASLLVFLVSGWLWWRSSRTIDRVVWDRGGRHAQFSSSRGRLSLIVADHSTGPAAPSWGSVPFASIKPAPLGPEDYWTEGTSRFWIQRESPKTHLGPFQTTGGRLAILNARPAPAGQAPATPRSATGSTSNPPARGSGGPQAATLPVPPSTATTRPLPPATAASDLVVSNDRGNTPFLLSGTFARDPSVAPSDFPSETVKLYRDEFTLTRDLSKDSDPATSPKMANFGPAAATANVGYGFGLRVSVTPNFAFDRWTAPYWPLVCAAAMPPFLWAGTRGRRIVVRRRRCKRGMCLACGYDLAHNVSGVCPECGARV
jgi:hypothetical protein